MKRYSIIFFLVFSQHAFCQLQGIQPRIEYRICMSVEGESIDQFALRNLPSDSSLIYICAYQLNIWSKWDSIGESRVIFYSRKHNSDSTNFSYPNSDIFSFLYLPTEKNGNYTEVLLASYNFGGLPIKIEDVFKTNADKDKENELCILYSISELTCENYTCNGVYYRTGIYKKPIDIDNPYFETQCINIDSERFATCKCKNDKSVSKSIFDTREKIIAELKKH